MWSADESGNGEEPFNSTTRNSADLFRHVSADKADFYRAIMDVFAAAKRQYRLQLRPDEILAEARWPVAPPRIEELNLALTQLTAWGNLEAQHDSARVQTINDFYRARYLYRLSQGGEAVEAALATFEATMRRRAELQTVALEDIANRLSALKALIDADGPLDVANPFQDPHRPGWHHHRRQAVLARLSLRHAGQSHLYR
jgi:uncharacterized protein (TIGR02677 family)